MSRIMKIIIANPHGFCSGVRRAIETIEAALKIHGPPIYCLHEIVHNREVVERLSANGVRFVNELNAVPGKATLLFSAHGVSPEIRLVAERRGLNVIDATCPFVSRVHTEVRRFAADGLTVIIIGHRSHEEVEGVAGEAPGNVTVVESEEDARRVRVPDPARVGAVCQTTLSASYADHVIAILRERFPALRIPNKSNICYATHNRQQAVRSLARVADLILVLGSQNSANSRRLVETGESAGCRAVLVETLAQLDDLPLSGIRAIGLTSGASTPESFTSVIVERLVERGFKVIEHLTVTEESSRRLPLPAKVSGNY